MTIAIAAICDKGHALVVAADREIGIGISSTDLPDGKWHHLFGNWSIAISGNVTNATDVLAAARRLQPELQSLSVQEVRYALERAYREMRLACAEGRYLAGRGLTLKDFRDSGTTKLPATTFANIDAQISLFDFNTDLIVAGFGEGDGGPSIVTVTNPGVCVDHTKWDFGA